MKSVLISIQPYWVFLIIAKTMGWNIDKEKTIEVRKNFPKAEDWNKLVEIYCSKDKKSFDLIPKEYQPLMEKFLGKVVGKWVCNEIYKYKWLFPFESEDFQHALPQGHLEKTCLEDYELDEYLDDKAGYGWHISDLVIYDKPKELSEFNVECPTKNRINGDCNFCKYMNFSYYGKHPKCNAYLKRPPQSWCYVESLGE